MLIPSIDFMDGRIVQLEQGERLAIETRDIDGWIARLTPFPLVQVIDLDAAMGRGDNADLLRTVCGRLPCQIGGGIRTVDAARRALDMGARRVIIGSALFDDRGVAAASARAFASAIGPASLVAAVDSRGGRVVIHGWKTRLPIGPEEAARALEPFAASFLYTHVDTEGLIEGVNRAAVLSMRAATRRRLIVAGGIRSREEIEWLDSLGIDGVVGMAIYKGIISLAGARDRRDFSAHAGAESHTIRRQENG